MSQPKRKATAEEQNVQLRKLLQEDMDFCTKIMRSGASSLFSRQLVDITVDYLLQHEKDFPINSHEEFVVRVHFCAGGLSHLYQEWLAGNLPLSLDELTARAEKLLNSIVTEMAENSI